MIGGSVSAENISPTTDSLFNRNLTLGIRGDDVSALQQFLIAGNFLKISTPTDYFGPLTRTALGAWQASVNINPSVGFFGPISRAKINIIAMQSSVVVPETKAVIGAVASTSVAVVIANNSNGSPVRLTIPKLNVDASFQYTGLTSDNIMEIPNNIIDVGWYTGSARPGEKGSAVVTGHVAQIHGGILTKPGVFANLHELRAGDKLYVQNDKGASITFVVRESRLYDPVADATDVFTPNDNGAHLNLITCEGTWNPGQLSYSQRLVVFTDMVQ